MGNCAAMPDMTPIPLYAPPTPVGIFHNGRYITQTHMRLRGIEHYSLTGRDFTFTDAQGGVYFIFRGELMTIREETVMLDNVNTPILKSAAKLMSFGATYNLYDPSGQYRLATLVECGGWASQVNYEIYVYAAPFPRASSDTNVSGMAPLLTVTGNVFNFVFTYGGFGTGIPVCQVFNTRFSGFSSTDSYDINIAPGVDSALISVVVTLIDAVKDKRQSSHHHRRHRHGMHHGVGHRHVHRHHGHGHRHRHGHRHGHRRHGRR